MFSSEFLDASLEHTPQPQGSAENNLLKPPDNLQDGPDNLQDP